MAYVLGDHVTLGQAKSLAQRVEAIRSDIHNKLTSVYKVKGSLAFSALTASLLVAANEGNVYNITDAFTTTADFVEGAGKKHTAGSNVVIVEATPADNTDPENPVAATYKFDVHAGDLSGFQELAVPTAAGEIPTLNASGQVVHSGVKVATDTEFAEMMTEVFGAN